METAEAKSFEYERAGGLALGLLSVPLNGLILQALGQRPMRLVDLRTELGGPAQTTLRGHLRRLAEVGAITNRNGDLSSVGENQLTDEGRELLDVTEVLAAWLAQASEGPISLGSVSAKGTLKALAGGWESTMLRAFAAQSLSLTQLDSLISSLSYPALERRLSAMRATGLVEAAPALADRTPYVITPWARKAAGPLAAAARYERAHLRDHTAPFKALDVEATFLLSVPVMSLPSHVDGTCQLAAHTRRDSRKLDGVTVVVDRGKILECTSRLDSKPRNWAVGSAAAWLDAIVDCNTGKLRFGGDEQLANALIDGLHRTLFPTAEPRRAATAAARGRVVGDGLVSRDGGPAGADSGAVDRRRDADVAPADAMDADDVLARD